MPGTTFDPHPRGGGRVYDQAHDEPETPATEEDLVLAWRTEQIALAGAPFTVALALAGAPCDLHAVTRALAHGCTVEQAVRIWGD